MAKRLIILVAALAGLLISGSAFAHFKLNMNVRIFHVVHGEDGLDVYMRTPMSYLVAGLVGPPGADGLPAPAPYTTNRLEDGTLMHLVAAGVLRADPAGLGGLALDGLTIETDKGRAEGTVVAVRVHPLGTEPGFATRAEAEAALAGGPVFPVDAGETYVGDAVADIHLRYASDAPVAAYEISVATDPGLPEQEATANLVLDYGAGGTRTFRASGLMQEPITVSASAVAAATTFVVEGVRHILEGPDHVLFVLCMIIGATTLGGLLSRVTGFTVGHTVTLIMGFFGIAPKGDWFIPVVETAIALSIILAAAVVLRPRIAKEVGVAAVGVTAAIGLLHGFGFSFMLHNILRIDAPNVWQSLLAFNVGVEIGQLLIVAAIWPLVLVLRNRPAPVWRFASMGTAVAASLIAAIWVVERAPAIFA